MEFLLLGNFLMNNEEEEENDLPIPLIREQHIKINHFYEHIALNYSLTDFKSHFRVSIETFEILMQRIGLPLLQTHGYPMKIQLDKQIAIALWYFGNQEVYRSIADRFGVSKDTIWRCVFNVAFVLQNHVEHYIKWPQHRELLNNAQEFATTSGFPGVVGAIDGTHIPISAPIEYPNSYVNRKGYHSITLQAICNYKMKFIDVFTGICGSVHDSCIWRLSDIKQLIENDMNKYFPENMHIIGDSAYPLLNYLLIPYRDNGHLNAIEQNYNKKLSATRMIIERAFATLKGRFRKLKFIYIYNTDMIPLVILACCILHNICIDLEDEPLDLLDEFFVENDDGDAFENGEDKREIIAHLIN